MRPSGSCGCRGGHRRTKPAAMYSTEDGEARHTVGGGGELDSSSRLFPPLFSCLPPFSPQGSRASKSRMHLLVTMRKASFRDSCWLKGVRFHDHGDRGGGCGGAGPRTGCQHPRDRALLQGTQAVNSEAQGRISCWVQGQGSWDGWQHRAEGPGLCGASHPLMVTQGANLGPRYVGQRVVWQND